MESSAELCVTVPRDIIPSFRIPKLTALVVNRETGHIFKPTVANYYPRAHSLALMANATLPCRSSRYPPKPRHLGELQGLDLQYSPTDIVSTSPRPLPADLFRWIAQWGTIRGSPRRSGEKYPVIRPSLHIPECARHSPITFKTTPYSDEHARAEILAAGRRVREP